MFNALVFLIVFVDSCFEDGTAYWGHSFKDFKGKDATSCQKACLDNSKCKHWTFDKDLSVCYLKDDLTEKKSIAKYVSGPKDCSAVNKDKFNGGPHVVYIETTNYEFVMDSSMFQYRKIYKPLDRKKMSIWRVQFYRKDLCSLGDVAMPSNSRPKIVSLLVKGMKSNAVTHPTSFTEICSDGGKKDAIFGGYEEMAPKFRIYQMNAPAGYTCLGHVVGLAHHLPPKERFCCVKSEYVTSGDLRQTWKDDGDFPRGAGQCSIWTVITGSDPYAIEGTNFMARKSHSAPSGPKLLKMDENNVRDERAIESAVLKPLQLFETNTVAKIWTDSGSGASTDLSLWKPGPPSGYYVVSHIAAKSHRQPTLSFIMKASKDADSDTFMSPRSYHKIWSTEGRKANAKAAIWRPVCPAGYVALGNVATDGWDYPKTPFYCIKAKYTTKGLTNDWKQLWTGAGTTVYEAVTSSKDLFSVRGIGIEKSQPPYFLKSDLVTYFHEKPIKKMSISDIKYNLDKNLRTDGPNKVFKTTIINRSFDTMQTGERTIEYSFTEESTYTFGASISLGVSVTASGGVPLVGGVETTVSVSATVSFETGTTKSKTFTDSVSAPINVPPR